MTTTAPAQIARRADGVEGLILCGGAGRRVDGRDKGLLTYRGEAAVCAVARQLRPHCTALLLSVNRHADSYRDLGLGTVLCDAREGFAGPLAGLEVAAVALRATRLLVLPCDVPAVHGEVPRRLLETLDQQADTDVAFARTGERDHYLCAAIRRGALESVSACLDAGEHSVRGWLAGLRSAPVSFEGEVARSLRNFNRLSDWTER